MATRRTSTDSRSPRARTRRTSTGTGRRLRERLAQEALEWVGTPFHWRSALKGEGCDCAGLVLGVGRACGLELGEPPVYTARAGHLELLAAALEGAAEPLAWEAAGPGDVRVWGGEDGRSAHAAILVDGDRMVHACNSGTRPRVALTSAYAELPGFRPHSAWRLRGR